jgi:cytochrome b561
MTHIAEDEDRYAGGLSADPVDTVLEPVERPDVEEAKAAPGGYAPASAGDAPGERPEGGYSPLQRRLHWSVAALVVLQLVLGTTIGAIDDPSEPNPLVSKLLAVHLVIGTIIFGLMLWRLSVRRRLGAPPSPEGTPFEASLLARINHLGFYGLLLALPVLGWLAYLTKPPAAALFGSIHGGLALTLFLAICAHLGGVAYHKYIRHDGSLRRMTG